MVCSAPASNPGMGSESYHEPYGELSGPLREMHRALVSLIEELEAIDWYASSAPRSRATPSCARCLLHNRDEEIEHAMMNLEWIRRNDPLFDEKIRTYLQKTAPITEIESSAERGAEGPPAGPPGGLGIGSLKKALAPKVEK